MYLYDVACLYNNCALTFADYTSTLVEFWISIIERERERERGLVIFLIHIGYETELCSYLSKFNITVRGDFDLLDSSIIRDPTLINEPTDCKIQRLCKAFLHRIYAALQRFKASTCKAVANFFVQSSLIDLKDLASYDFAPPQKYRTGHVLDHA